MLKRFIATAVALAASSAAMATVVVTADILDPTDGGNQPPAGVLSVDILVDCEIGAWTASGVRAVTSNGATLRYAADPNTGAPVLVNPGTANRFVTFFSRPRPRDADARYTNGAAATAGRYSPTGPTPTTTPGEVNVAYFSSPPPTIGSPAVDGAVFRISINLPAGISADQCILTPGTTTPPTSHPITLLTSVGGQGDDRGSVAATFDAPQVTGLNWVVSAIPEPASLALLVLGGLAAFRRR